MDEGREGWEEGRKEKRREGRGGREGNWAKLIRSAIGLIRDASDKSHYRQNDVV